MSDFRKVLHRDPRRRVAHLRPRRTADWRIPVDGRAPRLGPRELIAGDIRHDSGRFARIDPFETPKLWGRWHWLGLTAWGVAAGVKGWRMWRRIRPFSSPADTLRDPLAG